MNYEIEFLTAAVLVSAVLHIRADYKEAKKLVYFFKPITMLLIVIMGVGLLPEKLGWYHIALLVGLLFSICGDVALMWPSDKFLLGLVSFLTAHVFYISGLLSGLEFAFTWYVWPPLLLVGVLMFLKLRSGLGNMQVPVLVYILTILIMGGIAWERHLQLVLSQTLFAVCGASLFLISDALLAWNRFQMKFKSAQLFILSTYYAAQWTFALSLSQTISSKIS
ncbi:MAG: lysoplasmalogenase [SAR324 cluster bacterium]|nr:lysoplasmalogenase [SAR324 cluster bacterium]MBL7035941.1 lysoplasmalogenase [SAR324 cluster bacterium]